MPAVMERNALIADYETFAGRLEQPSFVADLRAKGLARFEEVGFPTRRDEAWRQTNVAPIAKASFRRASTTEQVTKSTPPATMSCSPEAAPLEGTQGTADASIPAESSMPARARCQMPPWPVPEPLSLPGLFLTASSTSWAVL